MLLQYEIIKYCSMSKLNEMYKTFSLFMNAIRLMNIRAVQNNSGMSDEALLLRRLLGHVTE